MNIENKRYNILSRGEDQPETFPEFGGTIRLHIRDKNHTKESGRIEIATLTAYAIRKLGHFAHISGEAKVDEDGELLPCVADFETYRSYPRRTLIGELVLKKTSG